MQGCRKSTPINGGKKNKTNDIKKNTKNKFHPLINSNSNKDNNQSITLKEQNSKQSEIFANTNTSYQLESMLRENGVENNNLNLMKEKKTKSNLIGINNTLTTIKSSARNEIFKQHENQKTEKAKELHLNLLKDTNLMRQKNSIKASYQTKQQEKDLLKEKVDAITQKSHQRPQLTEGHENRITRKKKGWFGTLSKEKVSPTKTLEDNCKDQLLTNANTNNTHTQTHAKRRHNDNGLVHGNTQSSTINHKKNHQINRSQESNKLHNLNKETINNQNNLNHNNNKLELKSIFYNLKINSKEEQQRQPIS